MRMPSGVYVRYVPCYHGWTTTVVYTRDIINISYVQIHYTERSPSRSTLYLQLSRLRHIYCAARLIYRRPRTPYRPHNPLSIMHTRWPRRRRAVDGVAPTTTKNGRWTMQDWKMAIKVAGGRHRRTVLWVYDRLENDRPKLGELTMTNWNADDEMNGSCHYIIIIFQHKYNNNKNTTHSKCVLMFSTNAKFSRHSYNALG